MVLGQINTPGDILVWRQLVEKEKSVLYKAPRREFSLRGAISREEVPQKHKVGHIDPSQERKNKKGFDPEAQGWDPKGELAAEFRKVRKQANAQPQSRFLFPETTAQENGWCLKVRRERRDPKVKLPPTGTKLDEQGPDKVKKELADQDEEECRRESQSKVGLGKWASESQLSATLPTELSRVAPSVMSSVLCTELSRATSFPGFDKDTVALVQGLGARVDKAMKEIKRYGSYGDRGNKRFFPLGETDATAYANAFTKATSGVPPHKWDPRGGPADKTAEKV